MQKKRIYKNLTMLPVEEIDKINLLASAIFAALSANLKKEFPKEYTASSFYEMTALTLSSMFLEVCGRNKEKYLDTIKKVHAINLKRIKKANPS